MEVKRTRLGTWAESEGVIAILFRAQSEIDSAYQIVVGWDNASVRADLHRCYQILERLRREIREKNA